MQHLERVRPKPEAPSVETIQALLAHVKVYDAALTKKKRVTFLHDLMMLYIATGVRTAEILALTWPAAAQRTVRSGGYTI